MLVDSTSPSSSPSQEQTILFQIVAGTYERLLYGFNVLASSTSNSDGAALTYKLEPSFIYPSHLSCIKAVATTDKYLATGATDEHIKLYDLSKKRELGSLILQHEGSITGLSFYADSYLISASEDGSIGIFKRMSSKLGGDWEKLKSLTAHKGGVNSVDVHPSGKIALSVGKDKTLKCWDLTRGLCARSSKVSCADSSSGTYASAPNMAAEAVMWSPSGRHYVLLFRNSLQVVDIESGTVFGNMSQKSKINCARCVAVPDSAVMSSTTKTISSSSDTSHREVLIAGCEDGKVVCWSLDGKQVLFEFDTRCSDSRVKDIQVFSSSSSSSIGVFIITCSSNGLIKLWDMKAIIKGSSAVVSPDPLAVYDTKCRLTCIASSHARGGQKYVSAEEEAAAAKTNVSGGNGYVTESEYEGEELARKRTRMSVSIDGEEKNNMNENNGNKCMKKKVFKKRRTETKTNTNRNATSKLVEAGEGEKRKQNMMIKKQKSAKKPTSAKLSAKKEEKRQKFVKKAHASTCADAKVIAK